MQTPPFRLIARYVLPFFALGYALVIEAQVPNTLKHSITPPQGVQSGAKFGSSVATEGALTAVGAPFDDAGAVDAGVVVVFNTTTGGLLNVIANPSPESGDDFGTSVAISGTRLVVGASGDSAGGGIHSGSAYVYDLSSATPTVPIATLSNPDPAVVEFFGRAVAISGARVIVGAPYGVLPPELAGRAYVFDLNSATPGTPILTLVSPNTYSDYFGAAVGIAGTRLIVGASNDNTGASGAGRAYVYDLSSATPAVPTLTLDDPVVAENDAFAASLAISGTRLIIGAAGQNPGPTYSGVVHVYDLAGANPAVPVRTLSNPTPSPYDGFGTSLAISGTRILVGTANDATLIDDGGTAYLYDLNSGTPGVPIATFNNPTPAYQDRFGWSVAISGTNAVIGALNDDGAAPDAGAAYLYDLASATPAAPIATLTHTGPSAEDLFGGAVAISGTLALVSAVGDDTGASDAGSAYVYDLVSVTPSVPLYTLNNPNPVPGEAFGSALTISGMRAVVATQSGIAYVYNLAGTTPTVPVAVLNLPDPSDFSPSVAISGTYVVVGAPYHQVSGTPTGIAYVYNISSPTPAVPVYTLNDPNSGQSYEYFGWSVGIAGTRVVVGVPDADAGATDAGRVDVYDLSSATPTTPVLTLSGPALHAGDQFGEAVAISGTRIAVGALGIDSGVNADSGGAFVYDLSSATPTVPVHILSNPSPAAYDNFGDTVAISGLRVVVSSPYHNSGAPGSGAAYVYDLSGASPTIPVATLSNPSPAEDDNFGASVAIDGTAVAVGTPFDDTTTLDKGYAYVFGPANNDIDGDGLLDTWEYARFGTTAGHSASNDADGDGLTELLEEAFNRDPTQPDSKGIPAAVNEGGFLTITISKRAGVNYTVESAATPNAAAFSSATTTVLINNLTTLKVRDNVPIVPPNSRFLHVKVTAAP